MYSWWVNKLVTMTNKLFSPTWELIAAGHEVGLGPGCMVNAAMARKWQRWAGKEPQQKEHYQSLQFCKPFSNDQSIGDCWIAECVLFFGA